MEETKIQARKYTPEEIQIIRDTYKKRNKRKHNLTRKRRNLASKTMLILELNKIERAFENAESELVSTQQAVKDFAAFTGFLAHPQINYDVNNYLVADAKVARTDVPAYVMCQNCMHLNIIREGDKQWWAYLNFVCDSCSHLLSGIVIESFPSA